MRTDKEISVTEMQQADLEAAAEIHGLAFTRQQHSLAWLESNLNARPKTFCYVASTQVLCIGYIIWSQKAGFRADSVIELEQIAVAPDFQGRGVGSRLITETLPDVGFKLNEQGSDLKHILVTTRADNHAQNLYKNVLGAKVEATISGLYSADEVIMVARDVKT